MPADAEPGECAWSTSHPDPKRGAPSAIRVRCRREVRGGAPSGFPGYVRNPCQVRLEHLVIANDRQHYGVGRFDARDVGRAQALG